MLPFLQTRFGELEKIINLNGGRFFIDDTPRACDFAVFTILIYQENLMQR